MSSEAVDPEPLEKKLIPFHAFEAVHPKSRETGQERMKRRVRCLQYNLRKSAQARAAAGMQNAISEAVKQKHLLRINHNNAFRAECDNRIFNKIDSIYNSYGGSTDVGKMLPALIALEAYVDLLNDVKNHDTRILHRTEGEIMKLEHIIENISERCNDLKKEEGYVNHNKHGIVQSRPAADSLSSINPRSVEANTNRRVKRRAVVLDHAIHPNPIDATGQSESQTMDPMRLDISMDMQVSSKCVQSMPKAKTIKTVGSDTTSNTVGSVATGTTAKDDDVRMPIKKDDDGKNRLSKKIWLRDMVKYANRLCDCTEARTLCDAGIMNIRKTIEQSCDGSKHFSELHQMKNGLTMWLHMWNSVKIDDETRLNRIGTAVTNLMENIVKLRKRYDEFMLEGGYVKHNAHGILKARTAAGGLSPNSERELPEGGPPSGS